MTVLLILAAVCIVQSAALLTFAWLIGRCIREHTKLARAFARSKAPNYAFSEKEATKGGSDGKHVTLSERQVHTTAGKSSVAG